MPLLTVNDLIVADAARGENRLVDGVSFSIGSHEALGLVGESGSGKSLTLRAILGLLPTGTAQVNGEIRFDGALLNPARPESFRAVRGRGIGMIFQDPMTALNPVMAVGAQIAEAVRAHQDVSRSAATTKAIELMELVGIDDARRRARAYPHEFSGGMRQRIVIAIALAGSPSLLLCDEPTTALDVTIQKQILEIIADLRATRGLAVLFVTHDLAVVAELCERVAVMYAGQIVETGATATVFTAPQHGYTLGLLRSAPHLAGGGRLTSIPGVPPEVDRRPTGCRFAPRCRFATPECSVDRVFVPVPADDGILCSCIHGDQVRSAAISELGSLHG